MSFDALLAAWTPVAGKLYTAAYEENGPSKHEIEDMRTNAEYEACCVECVLQAYDEWEHEGKPEHNALPLPELVQVVEAALNSEDAKYGWYRGNLPEPKAIRRALRSL